MNRFYMVLLCLCMLIICMSCTKDDQSTVDEPELRGSSLRNTVLYYATDDGFIIPVMRQIPWEEGIGCAALSYLVATQDNAAEASKCGLKTIIPDGTKFSLEIDDDKNAKLDVQNMPDLKNAENERIFLQSVVNTLTEFETVETVSITFDGKAESKMPNGTRVDTKMRAFMLNTENVEAETVSNGEFNSISIYIPDSTCMYNIPITGYSRSQSNFKTAMELFCKHSELHNNGLPHGTKVSDAEISEDGIARVNFTKEFEAVETTGDGILEAMYDAIYLTACEFGDVKELKLYVGAEAVDCSSCSVSAPLYVNTWR